MHCKRYWLVGKVWFFDAPTYQKLYFFSLRTKTQFFQVLCEEVMSKAMKMIDVDKIFLSKSNEGAVNVLNALKVR